MRPHVAHVLARHAAAGRMVQPPVKEIHVAQELQHEGRGRVVVDLVGRTVLLDLAVVHHDDAVGHLHGLLLVVRDEHAGDVHLVVQAAQPAAQVLAHLGVECAERLVEQQHLGLDGQGAGQGDALTLAARELMRVAVGDPVELHELEQLGDLGANGALARPRRLGPHPQAEGHVFEDRHVAEQRVVLKDEAHAAFARRHVGRVLPVEQHRAAVGLLQPRDDAQQRGLARARRPQQRHQFARRDVEVQVVAHGDRAEALGQVADFNAHSTLQTLARKRPSHGAPRRTSPPA